LITADALAWNDLGAYGQQRVKTPMIDAMALEGLRFTDYYAGSPHRPTAACTLATGLHSGHCPVREDGALAVLPADSKTLAKVMWYAGYATYMIGYWPLGEPDTTGAPQRQGYDLALWQPARGDGAPSLPAVIYQNEQSRELSALNDDLPGTTPLEWITDRAEAMLSKPPHRPFFLRLAYQLPKAEPLPVADEADADAAQRLHAATIEQFDRHVGRVLQAVRDAKLGRNTFVILTAERAPQQFGPVEDSFDRAGLLRTVGVLPEGKLRVPMIVWNAHGEPPTGLQTTPWAAWDLLPTLADLTSALHRPALLDGRSYAHLLSRLVLSGKTAAKSFYWETLLDPPGQAVRRGVWKATRAAGSDALQLFNLDRDPGETENLADTEQAMAELLEEIMRRNAQPLVEKRQAQPQ